MKIKTHEYNNTKIAELLSDSIIINSTQDVLDLLGNLYYQHFDRVIIHEQNIRRDFFDLKTGIAGEMLQKFSNYRFRLAIVGDFSKYTSKSIQDFIFECNKNAHINFVESVPEALSKLSG
ncbi:MAG: DUF4180 domain-containing protein [Bacteroidota bacterium]|nr:DUF4180 domain-containing protein [Bacteroidota bacterium]